MKMNHITIQSIAAASAVCISVLAAVFAWQQVELGRQHNRLSVLPLLQITPYMEGKGGRNGLYLSNDGLGPALIKGFSVVSSGVTARGFESDRWAEVLATTEANPSCFTTAWPKGETIVRPGVELPMVITTKADGMEACYAELIKLVGGKPIEIEVQYESIYGEKKMLSANSKIFSRSLDIWYRRLTTR